MAGRGEVGPRPNNWRGQSGPPKLTYQVRRALFGGGDLCLALGHTPVELTGFHSFFLYFYFPVPPMPANGVIGWAWVKPLPIPVMVLKNGSDWTEEKKKVMTHGTTTRIASSQLGLAGHLLINCIADRDNASFPSLNAQTRY